MLSEPESLQWVRQGLRTVQMAASSPAAAKFTSAGGKHHQASRTRVTGSILSTRSSGLIMVGRLGP